MTRPNDSSGQDAANWWNENGKDELERLEFLQKEMMKAMRDKPIAKDEPADMDEEEDMGPPDLPEDDDEMTPPDLPEDDEEMAAEPTEREMDMQERMNARRSQAMRRPSMRERAKETMKSGESREVMSKALRAEMELKRAFSPQKRMDLAKEGMALPDGSFPIVTTGDLENAIMAFGRAKDKAKAKRHIMKRARQLKRTDMIPEGWGKKDADGDISSVGEKSGKTMRYAAKEIEVADEVDGELTSPMSREELMDRVFKKKKKKPMAEEAMDEEPMVEEGDEAEEA
jgi:predicted GIY-YIG superfamily endonuclease